MKKVIKLYVLLLVASIMASTIPNSVKAVTKEFSDFSLIGYENSNYNKNPYVSFEIGQTYALKLTMYNEKSTFSGCLSGTEGFTFTSKDATIVTVGKSNGILTGKKVGSSSVVVAYPGLSSITIDVTITPVHKDKQAQKDHEAINAIEELTQLKFDPEEAVEYYNQISILQYGSMTKKDHFINIPNDYKINTMYIPLDKYLAEKKALFTACTDPVNILNITKLTSSSITVELDRKILKEDLISYARAYNTKYSTDMKLKVGLYLYSGDEKPFTKGNKFVALKTVSVGLNTNKITINIGNLLKYGKPYRISFYYSDQYGYGKVNESDCWVSKGLEFIAK